MSSTGTASSLATGISVAHELRLVFRGVDRVSGVSETITSKIRAMSGAIVLMGATSGVVLDLAASFGILSESQAKALDKFAAMAIAIGGVVNAMATLATSERVATAATWLMNEASAVKLALMGPPGWAILAGAAATLAAIGLYMAFGQGQQATTPTEQQQPGFLVPSNVTGVQMGPQQQVQMQHGGDFIVSSPTLFRAGEAGRERVIVLPEGRQAMGGGISASINIAGATDPAATARAVKRELELLMAREMGKFS
jgi:hypothetical protein